MGKKILMVVCLVVLGIYGCASANETLPADYLNAKKQRNCNPERTACLSSYLFSDRIDIEVENISSVVRSIDISFNLNNMQTTMNSENKKIVLQSGDKKIIESLVPINSNYDYGFTYDYNADFGVVDAKHDNDFEYELPFETGKKYLVLQSWGGRFSHSNEGSYHSYDFKMPTGSTVVAARGGKVVEIVDRYKQGGVNPDWLDKSNYVYILHDDGTIASYNHLKFKGVLVKVGDEVQQGQRIGLSGNTGYTTNPHLHFSVFKLVSGGKFKSVAIKVKTKDGIKEKLKTDYVTK